LIHLLLRHGANVNVRDIHGYTVLMYGESSPAVVKLLLGAGADANARNNEGRKVLEMADTIDNKEVVALLKQHGAKE